jgi:exocyst complex component 1
VFECVDQTVNNATCTVLESYITHVRITEDAAYPSSPPDPASPSENKKPRIIIVSVRKSGRVRMHKGRENPNGTFSIGKTWHLDDLLSIETFTGPYDGSSEQLERRQWAGEAGFIVTLVKPYFWQAGSQKEKDFFVASLIKIYRKYTGGRLPELVGFDPKELDAMVAGPPQPKGSTSTSRSDTTGSQVKSSPAVEARKSEDRERTIRNVQDPRLRSNAPESTPTSRPAVPEMVGQNLSSQASQPQLRNRRDLSPSTSARSGTSTSSLNTAQSQPSLRFAAVSQPPMPLQPSPGFAISKTQLGPQDSPNAVPLRMKSPAGSTYSQSDTARSTPIFSPPPERRRPQMQPPTVSSESRSLGSQSATSDLRSLEGSPEPRRVDTPPALRNGRKEDVVGYGVPSGAMHASSTGAVGINEDLSGPILTGVISTLESSRGDAPLPLKIPDRGQVAVPSEPATPSSLAEDEKPVEEKAFRPGLGPMIKGGKKSNKDLASTFRKAANAYNAFKPRAGGAGEKLLFGADKSGGAADGINGVFPAPALLRGNTNDSTGSATPITPATPAIPMTPNLVITTPEKSVTSPPTTESVQSRKADEEAKSIVDASKKSALEPEKPRQNSPEARRQKRRSIKTGQYLAAMDIDPVILENQTIDIESILAEFGWDGDGPHSKVDELETNLRLEVARVEAGSWLHLVEREDERVKQIQDFFDKAITECDELDGLLTLYKAELSVSTSQILKQRCYAKI